MGNGLLEVPIESVKGNGELPQSTRSSTELLVDISGQERVSIDAKGR